MQKEAIFEENKPEESQAKQTLTRYFEPCETVTAQHVLYNEFVKKYGFISKFLMYVLFLTGWGQCTGKDSSGSAGYHMKLRDSILNEEVKA